MTSHRIILLGEQGSGKSTLASYIDQGEFLNFKASLSDQKTPSVDKYIFRGGRRELIEVVDTPPFDPELASSFTKIIQNARDALSSFNGGFNIIVYCMPAEARVRTTYLEHMLFLKSLFGEEGLSHVCVVVTHLNHFMETKKEELRNMIDKNLPSKLDEWDLGAVQKVLFLDTATQPSEEFLSSFFNFMESKERISFIVEPIDDLDNPFCALQNVHIEKYLDHVMKNQKEAYAIRQHIILSRNNASSHATEISLRALEGFQALKEGEETLDSLLLRVKGSYIPFIQDVVNYFERKTVNESTTLIKDISEILKKCDNSSLFRKIDIEKLVKDVQEGIYEKILKSVATLFSTKTSSNQESLKKIEERLRTLLGLCSQFHFKVDETSQISFVNKSSVLSSTLTFLSLANFGILTASTLTLIMGIIGWKVGSFVNTKSAMSEIATKIYDDVYHSRFSKMLLVCMLIIYSDLDQEIDSI